MFIEICKKMQQYAAPEIKIIFFFFFYTAQIFPTHRILQNSSFSFKQNVFFFYKQGFIKKMFGFYTQEGVEQVALVRLQRNVLK